SDTVDWNSAAAREFFGLSFDVRAVIFKSQRKTWQRAGEVVFSCARPPILRHLPLLKAELRDENDATRSVFMVIAVNVVISLHTLSFGVIEPIQRIFEIHRQRKSVKCAPEILPPFRRRTSQRVGQLFGT